MKTTNKIAIAETAKKKAPHSGCFFALSDLLI